jgi:hypothetical protein
MAAIVVALADGLLFGHGRRAALVNIGRLGLSWPWLLHRAFGRSFGKCARQGHGQKRHSGG